MKGKEENSHDIVLNEYKQLFCKDAFLCGEIEGIIAIDWFCNKRNEINYKLLPMTEPDPPTPLFKYKKDIRKWIAQYLKDETGELVYDEGHCYIAYILRLIIKVIDNYTENGRYNQLLSESVFNFLKRNIIDSNGTISSIINKIHEIRP